MSKGTMITRKAAIAKRLGRQAQQKGMARLCQHDTEFQAMLSSTSKQVTLLKAWYAGYDEALVEATGSAPMPASELQERVAKAEAAGKSAFEAGKIRIPALDATLDPLLRGCQPGEGVKVLNAWLRSFVEANLAVRP